MRTALLNLGYQAQPEFVLKVDWSSLDLPACPEFQRLWDWVTSRTITALGILDRIACLQNRCSASRS